VLHHDKMWPSLLVFPWSGYEIILPEFEIKIYFAKFRIIILQNYAECRYKIIPETAVKIMKVNQFYIEAELKNSKCAVSGAGGISTINHSLTIAIVRFRLFYLAFKLLM
jgi:hypothetical protein